MRWLLLPFVIIWLYGCHRPSQIEPAKRLQYARLEFEHGDHLSASRDADIGYREYVVSEPDWAWRFRVLDGEVLVSRGLNLDSLAILNGPLPESLAHSDVAVRKEMFQGLADCGLRRFEEADHHLSRATELAQAYEQDALAEVILSRGTLAFLQGDYAAGRDLFHQALQRAQHNQQYFIASKAAGSLGLVSMYEEHFDEAIDWYSRSLEISRSLNARAITAKTLGNMGWCYYRMGDYERALTLSTEAKGAAVELGVDKDEMLWLQNIGTIENAQRSYSAAERDYQEALGLARRMGNESQAAVCLYSLANLELLEHRYDQAESFNQEAFALARAGRDHTSELYSIISSGYIARAKKDFRLSASDFEAVLADKGVDNYLRWEAEAGLTNLYVDENRPADADAHFREETMTLTTSRSLFRREESRLSFLSSALSFYEDYIGFLASHQRDQKALEVAEVSRAQTLAEGLGLTSSSSVGYPILNFNPRRTAKELNAIFLSYWLGAGRSYLWVITPLRVELFTLPPAAEIDPLVQSYRQALLGSRDVLETRNAAGQKLYDLLVAPAAKLIPKGSRVTILPDGSLYSLNFETLLAPAPQLHYWIEDVDVSYANSLTLLAAGAARHAEPAKKLLLVGDAVSPDAEFPKLPEAAAEMSGIESYFAAAQREVFAGPAATPESYFDSQPQDFSYIHFVAHGTASRTSPLDSAVILSKQGDDYKLYARDIIQHPLHADLVTISACHGEGVRTYSGEGLVGLSWAFLRAGAHGVIAALWEVNDNSTPQLMDHLYSEISKGTPPAVALRDAKLALLHSGTVYRRPFYWAPFQFYRGA